MRCLLVVAGAFAATAASAQLEWRGALELEGRWFPNVDGGAVTGSVAGDIELFQPFGDGDTALVTELFYRLDADDRRRTHGDVRQAYFQAIGRDVEFYAGLRRVFWGVTESRSLVDVINQTDLVENIDGSAKLGQPMLQLRWLTAFGTGDLYLLPGTRKRTFPGPEGFPRIPFPIATSASRFPDGRQNQLDIAARWQFRTRRADIGLSVFHGTARNPDFLPCLAQGSDFPNTADGPNCNLMDAEPAQPLPPLLVDLLRALQLIPSEEEAEAEVMQRVLDNLVLVPAYPRETRIGFDYQLLLGSMALRLEALGRHRSGEWTVATVAGGEYTLPALPLAPADWDASLLFEYLYDSRDTDVLAQRFSNDLFFGTRVSLNDLAGTTLLAGAIVEPDFGNRLYSIEFSRRVISQDWRLAVQARVFDDLPNDPFVSLLDGQDELRLTLTRFF